jgi:hypothetical protein
MLNKIKVIDIEKKITGTIVTLQSLDLCIHIKESKFSIDDKHCIFKPKHIFKSKSLKDVEIGQILDFNEIINKLNIPDSSYSKNGTMKVIRILNNFELVNSLLKSTFINNQLPITPKDITYENLSKSINDYTKYKIIKSVIESSKNRINANAFINIIDFDLIKQKIVINDKLQNLNHIYFEYEDKFNACEGDLKKILSVIYNLSKNESITDKDKYTLLSTFKDLKDDLGLSIDYIGVDR